MAYVRTSLARVPWGWEVEAVLELPVEEALRRIPATLAELADEDGATVLRMRADSLAGLRPSLPASAVRSSSGGRTSCARACER